MNTFVCPRGCDAVVEGIAVEAWHECERPYKRGDGTHGMRLFCDKRECALAMMRLDNETRSVQQYELVS